MFMFCFSKCFFTRFANKATFLTIYTQEAHPTEGGDYLDYFLPVSKHMSLQQRLDAAGELVQLEELPGPLLVDNMQDEASKSYGSFPDRLYVILDGVVVFQGGVGPHGYLPKLVENWLEQFYS
jgi:thyroxine 5-deiodinase